MEHFEILMRRLLWTALLCVCLSARLAAQQVRHEVVRGRVMSDSGGPIRGAAVSVTRTGDKTAKTTMTGPTGDFTVDWPDGTGDYVVAATAAGFQSRSMPVTRTGTDSVLVANLRLTRSVQQLATVISQATRPTPDRDPASFAAGGIEGQTFPQNAARRLGPDGAGDLTAIAGMLPGVALTPTGISTLGLPSSQNSIILGGLAFASADIPRDASTRVRVQTSSYDPSNGWFSGAQTAVDLNIGDQFTSRTAHLAFDAPALEYNDPVSSRLGQRFTNFNGSIGGKGQLVDDRWAYNYGLQGGRRAARLSSSLLSAD